MDKPRRSIEAPASSELTSVSSHIIDGFALAEMIVLWSARLWFLRSTRPAVLPCHGEKSVAWDSPHPIWETAAAQLHGLLNILFAEVERPLDFRCSPCLQLGRDEVPFLSALAAFQDGQDERGRAILAAWLSPAALPAAVEFARGLAQTLAAADLLLPVRQTCAEAEPL